VRFRLHGRGRLRHLPASAAVADPLTPDRKAHRVFGNHTFTILMLNAILSGQCAPAGFRPRYRPREARSSFSDAVEGHRHGRRVSREVRHDSSS
jgi:hypothetical protein